MTKEYLEKVIQLVTAAFGLVAALAWNEAIQDLINSYFPNSGEGIAGKFVYAVLITVLAVWITTSLARLHDTAIKREKSAKQSARTRKRNEKS